MYRIGFILLWAVVLGMGCQPSTGPRREPVLRCKGKGSIEEALESLRLQRVNLHPIRASAKCYLEWTDPDGSMQKETVDAQLRFVPPDRLFVRGDKFGEIRFGTNEEEFWLMVKPQIDTYWWGFRETADQCQERLQFNPWHVTEALGTVQADLTWTLDWHDGYDILTKTGSDGATIKKIWIRACDYQITSIETTDPEGLQAVQIHLDQYAATEQGLSVPTVIEARHLIDGRIDAVLRMELRGIGRFQMEESKQKRLFSRPSPDHYGTVYRLSSTCDFVLIGQ